MARDSEVGELAAGGPVDAWDVRLPPKNLEGAWPQAKDELSSTSSNKEKPCGTMADSSGSLRPIRPLNVITRYRTGEADLELSLRIRLPPTWDVKTVLEAIIEPFVKYDGGTRRPSVGARAIYARQGARVGGPNGVWGRLLPQGVP